MEAQNHNDNFLTFLQELESTELPTNTTATGSIIIQQSLRNELRKRGLKAFGAFLKDTYGDKFDILETKEGLVIAVENAPGDFTLSWEIKCSIKSTDFDPFEAAAAYDDAVALNEAKKAERERVKEAKAQALEEKRAAKLREIERKAARRANQNSI